jgi:hypothetical protein
VNIQQTIISGIRESLYRHDYLVLPGFGGFVLKRSRAHVTAGQGALHPPSRSLGFNGQLRQDDGILASWLAKHIRCSHQEAGTHLAAFSSYCKSVLDARRRLSLPGIGFFYLDFESNVCFEPQADVNYDTESFGLSALQLKPLEPTEPHKRKPVFADRSAVKEESKAVAARVRPGKLAVPVVASIVVIAMLAALVSYIQMGGVMKASLFGSSNASTYVPSEYAPLGLVSSEAVPADYIADSRGLATMDIGNKTFRVKLFSGDNLAPGTLKSGYEVVLGCFGKPSNAKRLVAKLRKQGIPASISGRSTTGLLVVSAGPYPSHGKAVSQAQLLSSTSPGAWVRWRN